MRYGVTKQTRRVEQNEDGSPLNCQPFNVKRYYVTWGGLEPTDADPYLSVWADGSLVVRNDKMGWSCFMYDDQWKGMIKAVRQAIRDKETESQEKMAKWLLDNGDETYHCGRDVSISINEAKRVLSKAAMRWKKTKTEKWASRLAEVRYKGRWLHLCRTDLMDDVCTFGGNDHTKELEALRRSYLSLIRYGARIGDGRFAVVDQFSDG